MDGKQLLIATRIEAAKEAIHRARFAFLITVFSCLALLLADWNGYFSWYRFFISSPRVLNPDRAAGEFPRTAREKYLETAQDELIKSWVESRIVSVAPLGLRFGVSDIGLVGPAGLVFVVGMLWFCTRRENRAIVGLVRDLAGDSDADVKWAIFHALANHLVFHPVGEGTSPLRGLDAAQVVRTSRWVRIGNRFLGYLPVLTTLLLLGVELLDLYVMAPTFREMPRNIASQSVATPEHVQLLAMEIWPVLMAVVLSLLCFDVSRFSDASVGTLREFEKKMLETS